MAVPSAGFWDGAAGAPAARSRWWGPHTALRDGSCGENAGTARDLDDQLRSHRPVRLTAGRDYRDQLPQARIRPAGRAVSPITLTDRTTSLWRPALIQFRPVSARFRIGLPPHDREFSLLARYAVGLRATPGAATGSARLLGLAIGGTRWSLRPHLSQGAAFLACRPLSTFRPVGFARSAQFR